MSIKEKVRLRKPGAGRPKGEKPPRQVTSFTLEDSLLKRLEDFSQEKNSSKSEVINQALSSYLQSQEAVKKPSINLPNGITLWAIVQDHSGQLWAWLSSREHLNLITGELLPDKQIKISKVIWEARK